MDVERLAKKAHVYNLEIRVPSDVFDVLICWSYFISMKFCFCKTKRKKIKRKRKTCDEWTRTIIHYSDTPTTVLYADLQHLRKFHAAFCVISNYSKLTLKICSTTSCITYLHNHKHCSYIQLVTCACN